MNEKLPNLILNYNLTVNNYDFELLEDNLTKTNNTKKGNPKKAYYKNKAPEVLFVLASQLVEKLYKALVFKNARLNIIVRFICSKPALRRFLLLVGCLL